jgi:hypothetical protein
VPTNQQWSAAAGKKDPEMFVGNLHSVRVSVADFRKQHDMSVSDGYSFVSATVYFSGTSFQKIAIVNLNGSSLQPLQEYFSRCQPGDVVTFDNVRVKKDGVGMMTIAGKSYSFTNEIEVVGYPSRPAAGDDSKVFLKTEIEPSFIGGNDAWRQYLQKNLNVEMPSTDGWKAGTYTIVVQFIVHTDGSVSDVTTTDFPGSKTAQHCINLIKNSPKWSPAIQNDRKVNAYRKQPITFVVEEKSKKAVTEIYSVPLKVHLLRGNTIDTYNMVGNGTFSKAYQLFYVNGKLTSNVESIKKEDVVFMESYDAGAGKKIFGEKGKYGVLMIKTKS